MSDMNSTRHWLYRGDVNLEHGGTFFSKKDLKDWESGSVSVLQVVAGSDIGARHGSTDYWQINSGSVFVPEIRGDIAGTRNIETIEKFHSALKTCGLTMLPNLGIVTYDKTILGYGSAGWREVMVDCLMAHNGMEDDGYFFFVTKDAELYRKVPPDIKDRRWHFLREGTDLNKWFPRTVLRNKT